MVYYIILYIIILYYTILCGGPPDLAAPRPRGAGPTKMVCITL